MLNLLFLGKPGAGKGTQASLIKDKLGLHHISTGVLFRDHLAQKTQLGIRAGAFISRGELVPDEITTKMLQDEVLNCLPVRGIIFDGYPRTIEQAKSLDQFLQELNTNLSIVIAIEMTDEILIKRILKRAKEELRADDKDISKIRKRLSEYSTKTLPLRQYYSKQNKLNLIDGAAGVHQINSKINQIIEQSNTHLA